MFSVNRGQLCCFRVILTDNVVDDTVDVVPGEHLPGERELYGEKPFWLELNAFTPELNLVCVSSNHD